MIEGLILAAAISSVSAERVVDSSGETRCVPSARACAPVRTARSGRGASAEVPADLAFSRQDRVDLVVIVEPERRRRR